MNHPSDSYKLCLWAQSLAEDCMALYYVKSRGERDAYYLMQVETQLELVQTFLAKVKEETK